MARKPHKRRWILSMGALIRLGLLAALLAGAIAYMTWMPGQSYDGPLPDLDNDQQQLADRLHDHVHALAGNIGQRNVFTGDSLDSAADYITARFQDIGYQIERQTYASHDDREVANLIVEIPGHTQPDEIVIIGAHYDTVRGSPGANDNASGVAALIELARSMHDRQPDRTVRFVSFVNEEPPFFQSEQMGSYVYAQAARQRDDNIVAMMSMDGLGYYSERESSQHYPVPGINALYPDTGDFIGFVTRVRDAGLLRQALSTFREHAQLPSHGAALPGQIEGVGFSDHWAFWQHRYPGFLVTDTLPFRDPEYHGPNDTPDRLDYTRMALLVQGLDAVVHELADNP